MTAPIGDDAHAKSAGMECVAPRTSPTGALFDAAVEADAGGRHAVMATYDYWLAPWLAVVYRRCAGRPASKVSPLLRACVWYAEVHGVAGVREITRLSDLAEADTLRVLGALFEGETPVLTFAELSTSGLRLCCARGAYAEDVAALLRAAPAGGPLLGAYVLTFGSAELHIAPWLGDLLDALNPEHVRFRESTSDLVFRILSHVHTHGTRGIEGTVAMLRGDALALIRALCALVPDEEANPPP